MTMPAESPGRVYGVTGLPCSGKSFAAGLLADGSVTRESGCLFKADDVGHQVLTRPEVIQEVRRHFNLPDAIVPENDPAAFRRAIANQVFADREKLLWLESLVHPLVMREADAAIGTNLPAGRNVIVEAALMFGSGLDHRCERIFLIEAPLGLRQERAARRNWSPEELERRECRQRPLFEQALKNAKPGKIVTIHNDADGEALIKRLRVAL